MIRLKRSEYDKGIVALNSVAINTFFARAVIDGKVSGDVFVDNPDHPIVFYVVHPYGMSLLFGSADNVAFNEEFKKYALNIDSVRSNFVWMQAYPDSWDAVLPDLFGTDLIAEANNMGTVERGVVELNTRVNFKFNTNKYLEFKQGFSIDKSQIVRTSESEYRSMKGSVVPDNFWDNAEDFLEHGIGFSLYYNGKLATTAFSSCVHGNYLELGMETLNEFRGMGFAKRTCSALIDYCLVNNYEPIWACRLENIGSYRLALSLGFEPMLTLPYYRLSN